MMRSLVSLCFVGATATTVSQKINPLGQVISLLTDLEAKVTNEGEKELSAFKEYEEWCDDTIKDTGFDIKSSTTQKEKLEAEIGSLTGDIEASTSKIADLAAAIAAGEAELANATSIREKEAADFSTAETELLDVVDTISRAITILEREMQKNPASFAQVARGGFANVLNSLSSIVDAAGFSASDQKRLVALVQQSSDDDDSDVGAPAAAVYKSHSSSIFDTLEDLKEKAETQLSELRKAETDATHSYEMLKQGLEDQLAADNKDMDEEKATKAADEEAKATAEGDLSVTVADLKASEEKLATVTAECQQVAADHEATVAARAEELKVMGEAIEILKSTTSGAVSQTYSFIQISSESDLKRSEVITLVKKLAKKHHSAALAQLASRIAAVERYGDDPFAKVKGLIEDMITKLQDEAGAEATEKAYCDEQTAKTEEKKAQLDAEIAKLTTKIDQSSARSAALKEQVQELQAELAALAKQQAEMDKIRQETHADYVQAKADLEQGLDGVRKALVVLRDYYAAGDADAAFVQQPEKPKLFAASNGAATSIVGILEVVESDFATNLAKEETTESEAQEDYEKMTQENKVTKVTKDQDVKYKTQEFTGLDKQIGELTGDRDTASTELSAVLEYYGKINERCIAKPETYESRKARRTAEIAGLKDALKILESETAMVQRSSKRHGHSMRGSVLAA